MRTFFSRYPLWQTSQPSGTSEAPCGFILWIFNAKPDQPVFLPSPPATPNQKGFQPLAATEAQARWYSMMENLRRKRESSSWHPPWRWMSPAQILSTLCHSFRCLEPQLGRGPSRFFNSLNRKSFRKAKTFLLSILLVIFAFKNLDFDQSGCPNGRFSALFRPCLSHFSGVIDTSTHPAHLGIIMYWPDWLTAPEPAGTSFFCTGNGGEITGGNHEFLHNSCHVHGHTALMRRP